MADISKIRIEETTYEVKDAELRYMIDVLLGRIKPQEEISKEE